MHYKAQLDLYSSMQDEENPVFYFNSFDEMVNFMKICFANGYQLIVNEMTDEEFDKELGINK